MWSGVWTCVFLNNVRVMPVMQVCWLSCGALSQGCARLLGASSCILPLLGLGWHIAPPQECIHLHFISAVLLLVHFNTSIWYYQVFICVSHLNWISSLVISKKVELPSVRFICFAHSSCSVGLCAYTVLVSLGCHWWAKLC